MLVGAVGIENNDEWNFKDLRGTRRNVKSLKRNERACKGILIAPPKLPRFFSGVEILRPLFVRNVGSVSKFAARMASRHFINQPPHSRVLRREGARLPWAHATRLQQPHRLLLTTNVANNRGICFSSIKTAVLDLLTERARSACRDADRSTHPPH